MSLHIAKPEGSDSTDPLLKRALDEASLEDLTRQMLVRIGEDPDREGLVNTPRRVTEAWKFFTSGHTQDIDEVVNGAIFEECHDEMVMVNDIDFFSMCEHHLLPFFGKAHVAYIPNGRVVGLSKIPRLIDVFARRLQLQERLTSQIAGSLQNVLQPRGVAVVVEADHMCMVMRGVQKTGTKTVTSSMLGAFRDDRATRDEFLNLVRPRST